MRSGPAVAELAERYGRTPAQILLRWHVELGLVPLAKSEDPQRQRENLAVFDFTLAPGDVARLSALDRGAALHTSAALTEAWAAVPDDPAPAARWASLGGLEPGTIGRNVHDLYLSRGFVFPGLAGSAPPLLGQHDWVHVLAVPAKAPEALAAGSRGPWEPGGMSTFQLAAGRRLAEAQHRVYDARGAGPLT